MLSVLIPAYNFDIRDLVKVLSDQASKENIPFEIIVIDDASEIEYKNINNAIAGFQGVIYSEEPVNTGRSKIRNKLARQARYDNLLFLDCDSAVISDKFIKNYLDNLKKAPVIYGGRIYQEKHLKPDKVLHWLYGFKREQSTAKKRNQWPNRSFQTNNFLIEKEVLKDVLFNEKIEGYGHEDTLFGYELNKLEYTIYHIDNPIVHLGLESNAEFLRKTREGIKNLRRIMNINGNDRKLIKDITILSYYRKLKKYRLVKIFRYIFRKYEHGLRRNLLGKKPKLLYFDLYKLGYLCSLDGDRP